MGCGSSVAVVPDHAIQYDNQPDHTASGLKSVRPCESYDSGVGLQLEAGCSRGSTRTDEDLLPDLRKLHGPSFADRKPLPPHPFDSNSRATFAERGTLKDRPTDSPPVLPSILSSNPVEANHDIERLLQPSDKSHDSCEHICEESDAQAISIIEALPRPPTPEFLISGKPLRPLRGQAAAGGVSQKHGQIVTAVSQARQTDPAIISPRSDGQRPDKMLFDLHRSVDEDTQVAARPPSRGGLAFDLVFGEQQELITRVEKLKKRQQTKAPKLPPRKLSRSQVAKKQLEADMRRQQHTLNTITKLEQSHSTIEEIGNKTSRMEEEKRREMKQAQSDAMEKALATRKQHLEEMRDRIRAKNERIKKASQEALLGDRPKTQSNGLPNSILGF